MSGAALAAAIQLLQTYTVAAANIRSLRLRDIALVIPRTLRYFEFFIGISSDTPTVTLEGNKSDWQQILKRLERLYELGDEPCVWAEMLRPILRRFVSAFDGKPDLEFWNHTVYRQDDMCGQDDLSGWLTAFCVWKTDGKWNARSLPGPAVIPGAPSDSTKSRPLLIPQVPVILEPCAKPSASEMTQSRKLGARFSRILPKGSHQHFGGSSRAAATEDNTADVLAPTLAVHVENLPPSSSSSVLELSPKDMTLLRHPEVRLGRGVVLHHRRRTHTCRILRGRCPSLVFPSGTSGNIKDHDLAPVINHTH
ncbi:hypothetical protein C8Q79DRAFT_983814 [Trametes meyenii]|nr:hypothetical protein C8Q79DRAFT_983814 [Trametes meyenii]